MRGIPKGKKEFVCAGRGITTGCTRPLKRSVIRFEFRNYTLKPETGHINFSPVGFRKAAEDFLRCSESFTTPNFSVIPFFLCSRAIGLALKAMHLKSGTKET